MQTKRHLFSIAMILFFSTGSFAQRTNCNQNHHSNALVEVYRGQSRLTLSQQREIRTAIHVIDSHSEVMYRQAGVPQIIVILNPSDFRDDPELLALAEQEIRDLLASYGYYD